jgi:hypothetical protein
VRPWAVFGRSSLVVGLVVAGCFTDSGGEMGETGGSTGAAATPVTTGGTSSGGESSPTGETGETGEATAGSETTLPMVCDDPPDQPKDSPCAEESGCGCVTGVCSTIPVLGGWCGECLVDSDCDNGGCTLPNPLKEVGSRCNKGQAGEGCMSDAVCKDAAYPSCGTLYEVPPLLLVATCGQCKTSADCPDAAPYCTPDYDLANFGGVRTCVGKETRANDNGCEVDEVCASKSCGELDVESGLLTLGICGECKVDDDCPILMDCVAATVDLETGKMTGAKCM